MNSIRIERSAVRLAPLALLVLAAFALLLVPLAVRTRRHSALLPEFQGHDLEAKVPRSDPKPRVSTYRCVESGPAYHDPVDTHFNIDPALRTTCLFSDVLYDVAARRFVFVTGNASAPALPPLSVMGRGVTHQGHEVSVGRPPDVQAPQRAPDFAFSEYDPSNDTAPVETAVVALLARTYETHHGYTLFDGVFAIYLALARVCGSDPWSPDDGGADDALLDRGVRVLLVDGKGRAPMDDRFTLLPAPPSGHVLSYDLGDLAGEARGAVRPLDASVQWAQPRSGYVRVERLLLGLAGHGWAFPPQMAAWRGQRLREFRDMALPNLGLALPAPLPSLHVLIIERKPEPTAGNFFSRAIVDAERVWTNLTAAVHGVNATVERVFFEGATLAGQIGAVRRADVVVTLSGCAIENTPFMRDGSALVVLQYNRRWPHRDIVGTRHFDEYAQTAHVLMVDTRIDERDAPIANSGTGFAVHVDQALLNRAVRDALALVAASSPQATGRERPRGSLRHYRADGTVEVYIEAFAARDK